MPRLPRYVLCTLLFAATTAGCSQADQATPGQGAAGAGGSLTAGEQPTSGAAMQGGGRSMAGERATPSDAGANPGGRGGL